jgi:polyhydroxyalkanoate synthesis regulator protein
MVGGAYDEQIRQNLALFDRAMKMFSPFAFAKTDEAPAAATGGATRAEPAPPPADDALVELRKRMEEMQAQIEKLAGKS